MKSLSTHNIIYVLQLSTGIHTGIHMKYSIISVPVCISSPDSYQTLQTTS